MITHLGGKKKTKKNNSFLLRTCKISCIRRYSVIPLRIQCSERLLACLLCTLNSSVGQEPSCNGGDLGWIPGLGRSTEEGKGYTLQYSGLENSMDSIAHGVTKSRSRLNDFHLCTFVHHGKEDTCPLFYSFII